MNVASILRDETRPEHVRTEAAFAAFTLSSRRGYAQFLSAQASAFLSVEQALERAGVAETVEDWSERRRGDFLRDDLADLGVTDLHLQPPLTFPNAAEQLGGVYVLEGSRLGGKLLRSQLGGDAPVRFLGARGARGAWKDFLHSLDARLTGDCEIGLAVDAARRVFHCFEQAGRETAELCVGR